MEKSSDTSDDPGLDRLEFPVPTSPLQRTPCHATWEQGFAWCAALLPEVMARPGFEEERLRRKVLVPFEL